MISRSHRFHGIGALNHVYKKGQTARAPFMALRYTASKREDYRLAVVVSKKVSKSAVKRNRIRRRIYEIIRQEKKKSANKWPFDMAISVFDERIAAMGNDDLTSTIVNLLNKANISK